MWKLRYLNQLNTRYSIKGLSTNTKVFHKRFSFSKCDQIRTFIEEILSGELNFFCSGTLNYVIKYIIKILTGVTTDMTCQLRLTLYWVSFTFGYGRPQISQKVRCSCTWLNYCQEINWNCVEHKRQESY